MNRVNSWIAIIFAVAVIAGFFMKLVDSQAFLGLAGMGIGFFFQKGDSPTIPQTPIVPTTATVTTTPSIIVTQPTQPK